MTAGLELKLLFGVYDFYLFDKCECMLEWVWFFGFCLWNVICIWIWSPLESLGDCSLLWIKLKLGESAIILAGSINSEFSWLSVGEICES